MTKKWIQKALSKKGAKGKLHRKLGVPEGEKIPAKKMAKAARSKSLATRREVQMAKNMRKGR